MTVWCVIVQCLNDTRTFSAIVPNKKRPRGPVLYDETAINTAKNMAL